MSPDLESIGGVAHQPAGSASGVVVLTHGAGGSRESPLLIAVCDEWAARGWLAIRYNLPYRRRRPKGPPSGSAADLTGVAEALACARSIAVDVCNGGPVIAGGHSYGGRLTSMLVASQPEIADELTLFSYPLHPPGKPERLRTAHLGSITVPTVFTHGSADPFGSIAELRAATALIAAPTEIVEITGARHDLTSASLNVPGLAVDAALRRTGIGGGGSGTVET
ncbi:MAG: alpha/beta family hydrolase [Mycobacterium sp.]